METCSYELIAKLVQKSFKILISVRKIRKEKDEHSIAELRVQMKAMENALSAEIKRRIELNRQIERRCQNQGNQNFYVCYNLHLFFL